MSIEVRKFFMMNNINLLFSLSRVRDQFILALILTIFSVPLFAQISGEVFEEFPVNGTTLNTYGVKDGNELGIDDVTVTITDASGNVTTQTTSGGGTWSDPVSNFPVRVEFTWPNHPWLESSPDGSGSNTSVQFVSSSSTSVDFGLYDSDCYSDTENPEIMIPVFRDGSSTLGNWVGVNTMTQLNYTTTGIDTTVNNNNIATHAETGALYGVAYQKEETRLFSSAFAKRHVGFGPQGSGGVYMFEDGGSGWDLTGSFDLQGVTPSNSGTAIDLGTIDRVDSPGGNDNFLGAGNATRDMDAYGKVGKVAFGDIDFGPNGKLYLVNLNQRTLIVMDVDGTTASLDNASAAVLGPLTEVYNLVGASGMPSCTNGEIRPFALTFHNGRGYLGVVCDGESDNRFNNDNVEAYVLSFDPDNVGGGFTQEVQFDNFDYRSGAKDWRRWSNTWADTRVSDVSGSKVAPQPILSDIEFHENGDMVVGFMDRFGHQIGSQNREPVSGSSTLINGIAHGEILHVCDNSGTWEIEGTGSCPTFHTANGNLLNDYSGNTPGDESNTGAGEYYNDAQGDLDGPTAPLSGEASNGAFAVLKGTNEIISTVMDPYPEGVDGSFAIYGSTGGLHWFDRTDGGWNNHLRLYTSSTVSFRKSHGLGDVELLTPPAPIEIGNFVWEDTDMDGIQDPGENPVSGVQVELLQGSTIVATATTDANGNYIFSSDPNGSTTASHRYNITQLEPNMSYTLRFPTTSGSLNLTSVNSGSNDNIDSDANGSGEITVQTSDIPIAGANNHSFDVGYSGVACDITASGSVTACDDEGTGDPNDDTFTVTLNPTGSGLGSTYSVSGDITASNVSYGSAQQVGGSFPISGGNLTITITDDATGSCQLVDEVIVAPSPCSSCNITASGSATACDDEGTGDPNDDTFTVTLNPTGSGLGSTYSVSGDITASNVSYGSAQQVGGSFSISGGDLTITITDDATGTCQLVDEVIVAPSPCSTCNLTASGSATACDDEGTGDPNDDTFTVTLNPTGSGLGSTYSVSGDITASNVSYGSAQQVGGSFPISGGDLTITITDDATGTCQLVDEVIVAPSPCSTCNLTASGSATACDDEGTGDPNDDTFTVTLNPTGSGLGSTYSVSGDITANNVSYGSAQQVGGSFPISGGNLTITITDDATGSCQLVDEVIVAPSPCSSCNITASGSATNCDDENTSDENDDTFTVTLNPTGSGLGSTYSVSGDIMASNVPYGSAQQVGGSFLISGGNLTITITDDANGTCQLVDEVIVAPAPCSAACPPNEYTICDNDSNAADLTADAGFSNYIWYEYDENTMTRGAQVGTGQVLTVVGSDIGPAGSRQCYVYEADGADGCPYELCCPVCVTTEECCPDENCYGVQVRVEMDN